MATAAEPTITPCLVAELPMSLPPELAEKLDDWEKQSKSVSILVTGKTGTGKSCLVNKLVGSKVGDAKEGDALDPETSKVKEHKLSLIDGITVTVWDSPGLQDGTKNERQYLKDIEKKCKDVDLFVYCIRMSERRFVPGSDNKDLNAMKKLTSKLGKKLWDHAIIVLTFANDIVSEVVVKCHTEAEQEKKFIAVLADWRDTISTRLRHDVRVPEDVVQRIKVIPAAYKPRKKLPYPDGSRWLTHLWLEAVLAMKSRARPAMIKINQHRFAKSSEEISKQKDLVFEEKAVDLGRKCQRRIDPEIARISGICKSQGKPHISLFCEFFLFESDDFDYVFVQAKVKDSNDKKLIDFRAD